MQEAYGICIDDIGAGVAPRHAAALAAQLPDGGRLKRAIAPADAWSPSDYMLHSIEYSLRVLIWMQSKDAERGRNRPKPLPTPADEERIASKLRATDVDYINERLGIGGGA